MITEIRTKSTWKVEKPFSIGIGSHSMNPNTKLLQLPIGTIITWDDDSRNGNVWFLVTIDGVDYRGKVESGAITNVIKSGYISLYDNGNGFVVYSGEYLQRLLK